jgi:uncharacterized DUF497 family protein
VSLARYRPAVSRSIWDPDKSRANLRKHDVSFEEAEAATESPLARFLPDLEHSMEERLLVFGYSPQGRLLLVVTSESGPRPRIIAAWRATKRERREYEAR